MPAVWNFKPSRQRPGNALTPFQSWLVNSTKRNLVAVAARRSGKTVGVRALAIRACLTSGAGDVGYMAPTVSDAKRIFWRPLMEDLQDPAAKEFIVGKPNGTDLYVQFRTGCRLYLFSAEAPERVRGSGYKLFITDESDDPRFTPDVYDNVIFPALSDNLGRLVQIGTPRGRGRLYKEFRKGQLNSPPDIRDAEYESIQVSAIKAGIIPRTEIERARKTRPKRSFQQEYEATFVAPLGLVFDEWSDNEHIVRTAQVPHRDDLDEVIVGVDWGTARRGAMIVLGIDRVWVEPTDDLEGCEMARVWVLEEHSHASLAYADRSGDREGWWAIARKIQKTWKPTRWYCDPAGGSAEETEAKAAGYVLQLQGVVEDLDRHAQVLPGNNQVGMGISAVQGFLHHDEFLKEKPRLFVLDACPITIGEFQGYRWASSRSEGEYEERPVKKDDHCLDALRYAIYTHFFTTKKKRGRNDAHHEDR